MENNNIPHICPISERRYEEIPVEKVKVINSRDRDQEQFAMNVESIEQIGLLKPIRVNDKFLKRTGMYELICGEGRLLAHQKLGHSTVWAEVVTCTRKEAYLQSLIENIARTRPASMDFARELKRLHDEGWAYKEIARIACKTEEYIRNLIRLVERGEERLINGVEQGVFSMKFALQITSTEDAQIQSILMDAFDEGLVTTSNFAQARRIIAARSRDLKKNNNGKQDYTVRQLEQDIADATKAKSSYVRQAKTKENRFILLLSGINSLWKDEEFVKVVREQGLADRPDLAGDFAYES